MRAEMRIVDLVLANVAAISRIYGRCVGFSGVIFLNDFGWVSGQSGTVCKLAELDGDFG